MVKFEANAKIGMLGIDLIHFVTEIDLLPGFGCQHLKHRHKHSCVLAINILYFLLSMKYNRG